MVIKFCVTKIRKNAEIEKSFDKNMQIKEIFASFLTILT